MKIEFHPDVLKQLQRLPHEVAAAALTVAEGLAEQPYPSEATKVAGSNNDWRLRSGQYRIVYEIDDAAEVLRIFSIGKAADAYREKEGRHRSVAQRRPPLVIGRYSGRLIAGREVRGHPPRREP